MKRTGGDAGLNLGGRQQRAARLEDVIPKPVSDTFESETENFLLEQWSWGQLPAPLVQQHALKTYRDQLEILRRVGVAEDRAC